MNELSSGQLREALVCVCDTVIESEPMLTEIDNVIGDGDHGVGMAIGFTSLKKMLLSHEFDMPSELMKASGMELMKAMGGASGVIFGSLFIGGYETIAEKDTLKAKDVYEFFLASKESISRRGKAQKGDKTMLDALSSAVDAMQQSVEKGEDVLQCLSRAAAGATAGAEATKEMLPRFGRSKNFREAALGYPDPGAVSTSLIFTSLYQGIKQISLQEEN